MRRGRKWIRAAIGRIFGGEGSQRTSVMQAKADFHEKRSSSKSLTLNTLLTARFTTHISSDLAVSRLTPRPTHGLYNSTLTLDSARLTVCRERKAHAYSRSIRHFGEVFAEMIRLNGLRGWRSE